MTRFVGRLLGAVLTLYLVLPLVLFLLRAFGTTQRGFRVPGLVPAFLISVSCATASLALVVVFGIPLAYVLAHSRGPLARFVELLITLPLALPPVMGGIVMVYLVGPYSPLGHLFHRQLTESVYGIVIAMTFTSAPFLVLSARAAFSVVDPVLLDVASTLGHAELSRFFRIALPLAGPGIRAGMTMTWLRAFGEYGAVTILAYNPASLPVYTVNQFMARGLNPTLAPTLLALLAAAAVVLVGRIRWRRPRRPVTDVVESGPPPLQRSRRVSFDLSTRVGDFTLRARHTASQDSLAILGPSGSGKSVLLRSLVGLYGSGVGRVVWGGNDVSSTAPERRSVGYVAQGFSLFPHLTVWNNVMFPVGARREYARYWLDRLGLTGLDERYPSQLSGGQRQRVALAQALARTPDLLVLDEPFSALDVPVRRELQRELRRLQHETGLSMVVVTHDPDEAAVLANEILVLDAGHALQAGPTRDVLRRPASRQVARLLDRRNVVDAQRVPGGLADSTGVFLRTPGLGGPPGDRVLWCIRPEHWSLTTRAEPLDESDHRIVANGVVEDVLDQGLDTYLDVRLSPEWVVTVVVEGVDLPHPGDPCRLEARVTDLHVWVPS